MHVADRFDYLQRCLEGRMITILAGSDKQRLVVHEETLNAAASPSLQSLTSGSWTESKDGVIDWSHTDAATVQRFCTFLYLSNYNAPWPKRRFSSSPIEGECIVSDEAFVVSEEILAVSEESVPEQDTTLETAVLEDAVVAEPDYQQALWDSSNARPLTPIASCFEVKQIELDQNSAAGIFRTYAYPYAEYCYVDLLLAHARLYVFAQYHMCSSLQSLTLQRLVQVLQRIDCSQEHAADEIALLTRFVYDHTHSVRSGEEPLRKIVSHFVASNYTLLMRGDLVQVFPLGGDFTLDVGRKISRRLRAVHESAEALKQDNHRLRAIRESTEALKQEIHELRQELNPKDVIVIRRGR